jgi:anti-sigma factor RsiW
MNCTTAQNHWHAQQDGELSIEQQAALTSHLTGCAVCRAYIADLEAVTGALAELRDASSHIGETVTAGSPHRTGWRRHLRRMNITRWSHRRDHCPGAGCGVGHLAIAAARIVPRTWFAGPHGIAPAARTGRLARRQRRRIHPGRTIHAATPRSPFCFVQFGGIYRSR